MCSVKLDKVDPFFAHKPFEALSILDMIKVKERHNKTKRLGVLLIGLYVQYILFVGCVIFSLMPNFFSLPPKWFFFVGCVVVDVRIFFCSRPNNIFFSLPPEFFFLPRLRSRRNIFFPPFWFSRVAPSLAYIFFSAHVGPRYPSRATAELGTPRSARFHASHAQTHARTDTGLIMYRIPRWWCFSSGDPKNNGFQKQWLILKSNSLKWRFFNVFLF